MPEAPPQREKPKATKLELLLMQKDIFSCLRKFNQGQLKSFEQLEGSNGECCSELGRENSQVAAGRNGRL